MAYDFSRYQLTPDQQSRVDAIRKRPVAASGFSDQNDQDAWNAAIRYDQNNRSKAGHNRLVRVGQIASVAPFALAGGAALAGGGMASGAAGGAATTAGAAASGGAVPAAVGRFTLPSILKMAEIGIPAITGVLGMRSQNRALDRQAQLEQQALAEQMTFAREQEAIRRQEAERMFAEDRRRWESEERNRSRELAATEEERAYQRRLMDERESRRAPYRQASQDALFRLRDILGMGRRG